MLEQLSPKETRVLLMMIEGKTYKEIAWALGRKEITIKHTCLSIFHKLGAKNKAHAVALAYRYAQGEDATIQMVRETTIREANYC